MPRTVRPIRIEGNIAYVPLTQGREAIIDAESIEIISGKNWCAHKIRNTIYAATNVNGKTRHMHKFIMPHVDKMVVDHANGDGLDNRKSNLRYCTISENAFNQKVRSDNKSGFKGVYFSSTYKKWTSEIYVNKKKIHLGRYNTKDEAAKAYKKASLELHKCFSNA